jgi:TRAP-type mannitol/chloroaromatic compound transport system permease large subunit
VLDAFEMIFVVIPVVMPPLLMRVPDATWVAVLTLLILQTSFLIPPFGYSVLMVRNRSLHPLAMRRLARALVPYLAAQLCVLALALAFPDLVWRGPRAAEVAASAPAPTAVDTPAIGSPAPDLDEQEALERALRKSNAVPR